MAQKQPYKFTNPEGGPPLVITAESPERAQQILDANRKTLGLAPDAQFTVEPVQRIEPTTGGATFPEPQGMEGLTQPGKAVGKKALDDAAKSAFSFGRTEKGMEKTKDMSLMERLGRQDQAVGRSVEEGAGWFLPSEERVRSFFDKEKLDPAIRDMVPDVGGFIGDEMQKHSQQVEEGKDLIGTGGDFWSKLGGAALSPANELLLSSNISGTGPGAMLGRMGAGQAEAAGISALQNPEAPGSAAIQSVMPTAEFNILEQIGRLFGGKASKAASRIGKTDEEKAMADTRDFVKSQLEAAPKDVATPEGAPLAYQVGTQSADAVKAGANLNSEAFAQHKARMAESRGQEYERTKTALGDPERSATVLSRQAEEARHGLSPAYTQALKGNLPNVGIRIERTSVDKKTGKKTTTTVPVGVPQAFRNTLKQTPMYDLYVAARDGAEGGLATATAYAGSGNKPTSSAVAWQTIQKLKNGDAASKRLAKDLQDDLGNVNSDLRKLVDETHAQGKKERAADLAKKAYGRPDLLNDDMREAKSDPETWSTFQDAFRASALEEASKKGPTAWTPQRKQAFTDVLGADEAARLERHFKEQMRRRQVEDPVLKHETSVDPKKKALGTLGKVLKSGGYALRAAAGQGPIGVLAAMGPAASQFLKDVPEAFTPKQYQGLIDWYARNNLGPEPKKLPFSTEPKSKTRGAAGAGIEAVKIRREEERDAYEKRRKAKEGGLK